MLPDQRPDPPHDEPHESALQTAVAVTPVQLVLDLPHLVSFGLENFMISRSNAHAAALVQAWPQWPQSAAAICGPAGSGKSHLAQAWRARSGASIVSGAELSDASLESLEHNAGLIVEDIDRGIADERVLFHIFNVAREKKLFVLITSTPSPGDIVSALPDLRSRLRALPLAVIDPPDDALLQAVLVKLFADRQLAVDPQVISYMALHMERSMAAARCAVAAADELALSKQRKVTRAIAAEALALASGHGDDDVRADGA
jgi:chromosomal replication initiation ATPase DnaA